MWIFEGERKPENLEKNPWWKDENKQQTQPTHDAGSGNRTQGTLVGGDVSSVSHSIELNWIRSNQRLTLETSAFKLIYIS